MANRRLDKAAREICDLRRFLKTAKHASVFGKVVVTSMSTPCLNVSSVFFIGYHPLTIGDEDFYRDCINDQYTDRWLKLTSSLL